jgi:hypothetical protein
MNDHYIAALQQHDETLPQRAADLPANFVDDLAKVWLSLDEEARDIAVSCIVRMRHTGAGRFLLQLAIARGEAQSVRAARALITHVGCPDAGSLLAAARNAEDPMVRAALYLAAGNQTAPALLFAQQVAGESNPHARIAGRDALARLGHAPALKEVFAAVRSATADQVPDIQDSLLYIGDKRLAKALISWLHVLDDVTRLGSDRTPDMARQCDFAVWIAHRLNTGVAVPVPRLDNYPPAVCAAAKTILEALETIAD